MMDNANLYALLAARFPSDPDAVFLETPDGQITRYHDIPAQTARMVRLLQDCGVVPGERVVVQVEKSAQAVMVYLACLRAGAIYVPLNTAYTVAELDYFIADARPKMVICDPRSAGDIENIARPYDVSRVFTLDGNGGGSFMAGLDGTIETGTIAVLGKNDIAAILYTSGTTGRSKGAMLSHHNLSSNAVCLHKLWGFVPGDVLLHGLPIYHVHGLFVALHCAMLNGSKIWFLPKFNLEQVLELLPESTVMMGVPTFYVRLLDDIRLDRSLCDHMRLFIAGSAPLLDETFAEFERRTGHRILERYGMTEAGMITSNPYNDHNGDGRRTAGSVGYALPGVTLRVCDAEGFEVPHGEPGTLEIKGPNVFMGYWQNPEKTAAEFRADGYFITGDVSVMTRDGRIAIVGRAKDLIISGGFNVYPKEIESEIDAMAGVIESAVIGVAHRDFGEAVVAVVVRDDEDLKEQTIIAALTSRLARFKQPKKIFFVHTLPRNAMGKVQKSVLRETYAGAFA